MKTNIVVFGTENYNGTIELLCRSIHKMVDNIYIYSPDNIDTEFRIKNSNILNRPRGYGYWIWKPYFILKTMDKINTGDIILYLDVGMIAINDVKYIIDICSGGKGVLLFENRCGNKSGDIWKNIHWTKYDCFSMMDCNSNSCIYGNQVDAAFQVYKKNNMSLLFLNDYMKYCENENIVTDIPSIMGKENPEFIEHRHDQSILSLLSIKYNIDIERCPSQWGEHAIDKNSKFPTLFYHHKQRLDIMHTVPTDIPTMYDMYKYKIIGQ